MMAAASGKLAARNLTRGSLLAGQVEEGASLWAKFRGLMGRDALPAGDALWLPGSNGIHMMFMRFPIDCVFLGRPNGDGSRPVVGVRRALAPWTGIVWYVRGANGVLELPVGAVDGSSTAVGDRVRLESAS
jgi:uncharacterized membrane protein (UPF0127 family)